MNKILTTYSVGEFYITVNEEVKDCTYISIHDIIGEPCSGVLKHWGKKADLIKELEAIIKSIKQLK